MPYAHFSLRTTFMRHTVSPLAIHQHTEHYLLMDSVSRLCPKQFQNIIILTVQKLKNAYVSVEKRTQTSNKSRHLPQQNHPLLFPLSLSLPSEKGSRFLEKRPKQLNNTTTNKKSCFRMHAYVCVFSIELCLEKSSFKG